MPCARTGECLASVGIDWCLTKMKIEMSYEMEGAAVQGQGIYEERVAKQIGHFATHQTYDLISSQVT